MTLYYECPLCGASLDPGERCDCEKTDTKKVPDMREHTEDTPKRAIKMTCKQYSTFCG